MPSARYWRLTFYRTDANICAQIRELAFLDAAGVEQSIGGTAYASSTYNSSWLPAFAFDKNTATGWCSAVNQLPASIWYLHPSAVDIAAVRLYWDANINYAPTAASDMRVSYSDDGVNWQADSRVLQITDGSITASTSCTLVLVQPQPVQTVSRGLLIAASAPTVAGVTVAATAAVVRDVQDGGNYRLAGSTKKRGTLAPLHRRVQLYNQRDGRLIRETWSDAATGAYQFDYIQGGPGVLYFICTFDHTNTDRALIADQIVPEPMP